MKCKFAFLHLLLKCTLDSFELNLEVNNWTVSVVGNLPGDVGSSRGGADQLKRIRNLGNLLKNHLNTIIYCYVRYR